MLKQISKKVFALLLAVVLMFSVMPMNAIAVTSTNVNEDGYIEVYTIEDLYSIRDDLTANYILMNDIDLTAATAQGGDWDYGGRGWNPIGSNDIYDCGEFSGIFDGNGYCIKGMRINLSKSNAPTGIVSNAYSGLFANVSGTICNLHIVDTNITVTYYYGSTPSYTGAIAGTTTDTAVITNCSVSGAIIGSDSHNYSGGLLGEIRGKISNCYNTSTVTSYCAGGIVAKAESSATATNCYNTGAVYSYYFGGGIVGANSGARIATCYNTGNVRDLKEPTASQYAITNSVGGGVSNCYYLNTSGKGVTGATELTAGQTKLQSSYRNFDFENVWILNEYANHPYPQLRSNIQDMNELASLVSIIKLPAKTEYMTGDKLDFTGAIVKVVYVSGREETIAITDEIVSGFDMNIAGEQEVTVTVAGASDTYDINVIERPVVESITITAQPNTKIFAVGTAFDFSGAKALVSYVGGISETVDITPDMTTGGDINHIGKQTITYAFGGQSDSFEVEVVGIELDEIVLTSLPNKLEYLEGQDLDLTGMVVTAVMNNGMETIVASGYTVSGYSSEPGDYTITVTYLEKTATFDVTVAKRTLVSLVLNSIPDKLEYVSGQAFDNEGMQVIATYDNGDVVVAEDYTISGFDDVPGIKNVIISLDDKTVSFPVKVIARVITEFKFASLPTKLDYIEYDSLDTTGLKVEATYNDGITEEITDYTLTGFSSKPGTHTIVITYEGFAESFEINVAPRVLVDIKVKAPNKVAYYIGEEFDDTGMVVTACYNNGQEITVDDYQISGFDSAAPGVKTITVTYGGISRSFAVVVAERSQIETGGHITVGNSIGRLGEEVTVPVTATKNTGIAGFAHTITFDATALSFVTATATDAFADGTVVINDENSANGEVTILWFGADDISGDGTVYNLIFKVLEEANDGITNIDIAFDRNDNGNISGENVIFGAAGGSIEIRSYWLGDLDGDRKYAMVDLLQLAQYVSGKEMTLTDKQKLSADVNEDGIIDIHDVVMLNGWLLAADM